MASNLPKPSVTERAFSLRAIGAASLVLSLATGCAGAPGWVLQAPPTADDALLGIGYADHVLNESLRASVAENRARTDLLKRLAHCTERVMLRFWDARGRPEDADASRENLRTTSRAAKMFTVHVIRRIEIVDEWEDGEHSYRLARLDRDALRTAYEAMTAGSKVDQARAIRAFEIEWPRCSRATGPLRTFRKAPKVEDPAGCWTRHNRCA